MLSLQKSTCVNLRMVAVPQMQIAPISALVKGHVAASKVTMEMELYVWVGENLTSVNELRGLCAEGLCIPSLCRLLRF